MDTPNAAASDAEAATSDHRDRKMQPAQDDESAPASPGSTFSRNTLDSQDSLGGNVPPMPDSMPPPAYSASVPTQDPGQAAFVSERLEAHHSGYGTLPATSSPYFPRQVPREDMGGGEESGADDQAPLLGAIDLRTLSRRRKKRRLFLFCLVSGLLIIIFGLIIAMIVSSRSQNPPKSQPGPEEPPSKMPIDNVTPAPGCPQPTKYVKRSFSFDELEDLDIEEGSPFKDHLAQPYINGRIDLLRAEKHLDGDIVVDVVVGLDDESVFKPNFERLHDGLKINYDRYPHQSKNKRACATVHTIVWFKSNLTRMQNLAINTKHLSIDVAENFVVAFDGKASLRAWKSDVTVSTKKPFKATETFIDSFGGNDMTAHLGLVNLIDVNLGGGVADLTIKPQAGNPHHPSPANVKAKALDAELHVNFPTDHLPERDYRVELDCATGSVQASLVHGSWTQLSTVSGDFAIDIHPFNASAHDSKLETSSYSGDGAVTVHAPLHPRRDPALRHLASTHTSHTGDLVLRYPQQWEGTLRGTTTGKLTLLGKDVRVIRDNLDAQPGYNHVEARKGAGRSTIDAASTMGAVELTVGDKGKPSWPAERWCGSLGAIVSRIWDWIFGRRRPG